MPMLRLLLLRHAKSDRSEPAMRDHDRPLNARGRRDAPKMGEYLARNTLTPDFAIVSTARRTRETWSLVSSVLAQPPRPQLEQRLYDASARTIFNVIAACEADVHTLLVIGHNPGMHELAITLVATGDTRARAQLSEKFPTCGLAVIDFPVAGWAEMRSRSGTLERFVSPRMLVSGSN